MKNIETSTRVVIKEFFNLHPCYQKLYDNLPEIDNSTFLDYLVILFNYMEDKYSIWWRLNIILTLMIYAGYPYNVKALRFINGYFILEVKNCFKNIYTLSNIGKINEQLILDEIPKLCELYPYSDTEIALGNFRKLKHNSACLTYKNFIKLLKIIEINELSLLEWTVSHCISYFCSYSSYIDYPKQHLSLTISNDEQLKIQQNILIKFKKYLDHLQTLDYPNLIELPDWILPQYPQYDLTMWRDSLHLERCL